jgi:hypothetical protein
MRYRSIRQVRVIMGAIALLLMVIFQVVAIEQRNEVFFLRGPYNTAFFYRYNRAFRVGAALHFSHAKLHDVLLLTPFARHAEADAQFDQESVAFLEQLTAHTEPTQEYYAPYTARAPWRVLRTIDWTHMHHEQTYDIMSDRDIPWDQKKAWTERSIRYYLNNDSPSARRPCQTANILEVGVRRQVTPLTVLAMGVGTGIGPDSPDVRVTLAFQHTFGAWFSARSQLAQGR